MAEQWYMVAYDIRDQKRLQRVHRYLQQEGIRFQYSLYLISNEGNRLKRIKRELQQLISKQDDIRFYPILSRGDLWQWGRCSQVQQVFNTRSKADSNSMGNFL